jgi:tetraacyldisaccharide 4'-kinase
MLAPEFWDRDDALSRLAVTALTPFGLIYGTTVDWKARHASPYHAPVPVICIGNITAGGTGKTPVAMAIARALIARGRKPYFLSRGYGGEIAGPVLVTPEHDAGKVGDEPLLLARVAPTIVSRHRPDGAKLAVERGADVIVMDDGHQNFSLAKNLSIVVVDAERGFGNGRILPAGPLREPVRQGLTRADAIVLVGNGNPQLEDYQGTVLRARLLPTGTELAARRVAAFAGIGRPAKFFETLRSIGAEVVSTEAFADHHRYTEREIERLKTRARDQNAQLVTTEKDYVRMAKAEREGIAVLTIQAVITPAESLERLLDRRDAPR